MLLVGGGVTSTRSSTSAQGAPDSDSRQCSVHDVTSPPVLQLELSPVHRSYAANVDADENVKYFRYQIARAKALPQPMPEVARYVYGVVGANVVVGAGETDGVDVVGTADGAGVAVGAGVAKQHATQSVSPALGRPSVEQCLAFL